MRVAAEVAEELARAREGALGVDDPVLAVELILEAGEGVGVGERGAAAGEVEVAGGVRAGEGGEKLASEEAAEDAHRKEVAAGGGDPPRRVEREAPTRDDAVEVGMELEVAGPGVQHGGHAEACPQPGGIAADGEERLRGGAEQQREEPSAVAQDQRAERGGQGEDDVEGGALDAVEHFARDEGVADRGTDRAMAEEMLDRAELGAGLEEMGGEAVPERMGRDALLDATLRGDVAERPLGGVARERPVGRGAGEEIRAPGVRVAPVGAERGEQAWAQRDV